MEQELLEAFKRYVNIEDSDSDESLQLIVDYAEGVIYEIYGVSIYDRNRKDSLTPVYGYNTLYTPDGYIREINSLSVNGDPVDVTTDLTFRGNKIIITNIAILLAPGFHAEIDYNIGYLSIDDIPSGLKNALFVIAKKILSDSTKDTDTLSAIAIDIKESIRPIDDIPTLAKQALESHKFFRL
jgi:hypothetical protein